MQQPCVYILASKRYGTLYVGVTNNLARRVWEHKQGYVKSFTKTYTLHLLVYVEFHNTMEEAIAREKRIKRWRRPWKYNLIHSMNAEWDDLTNQII